jgi:hypothetical protein
MQTTDTLRAEHEGVGGGSGRGESHPSAPRSEPDVRN